MGRYGARADNPSVLPRDYTSGLMVALGAVGTATLLVLGVRLVRRRR